MADKISSSVEVSGNCSVENATSIGAIHGGNVTIGSSAILNIEEATASTIEKWTEDIIEMSVCDHIIQNIKNGKHWTSIVGDAGDGKTTLGYMILKRLKELGFRVFKVGSPDDCNRVLTVKSNDKCAVMLNDPFGEIGFDSEACRQWALIIKPFLENATKGKKGNITSRHIVFISREYILKEAESMFSKNMYKEEMFTGDSYFHLGKKSKEKELYKILNYYLKQYNITGVDEKSKWRVVKRSQDKQASTSTTSLSPPLHTRGIPYASIMYCEIRSKRKTFLHIEDFFKSPLKYVNETMTEFVNNDDKKYFLKLLLKSGSLLKLATLDDGERERVRKTARPLTGCYVENHFDVVSWAHPTIHESFVVVYGKDNPEFIIDYCDFRVLYHLAKVDDGGSLNHDESLLLSPTEDVLNRLCARFKQRLLDGDYDVFDNEFCHREDFVDKLFDESVSLEDKAEGKLHIDKRKPWGGETLLHAAARVKNVTAVKWLLHRGADVNKRDGLGDTALDKHLDKFRPQHSEVVQMILLLLRAGADVNITDTVGRTPLHLLCRYEHVTKELLAELLAAGADVGYRDWFGLTPLHNLCDNPRVTADILSELLAAAGADVSYRASSGFTPLDCLRDNPAVLEDGSKMMQRAMDLAESRDKKYSLEQTDTAALRSRFQQRLLRGDYFVLGHSFCRQEEFLEQLFDGCLYQGDVDDQAERKLHIDKMSSRLDDTLLQAAVRVKNVTAVKCLIHRCADVEETDWLGDTVLDRALVLFTPEDPECAEIIQMLEQAQADKIPRFRQRLLDGDYNVLGVRACQEEDFLDQVFDGFLYQGNADDQAVGKLQINKKSYGETLLLAAVRVRNAIAVLSLLRRGADVNETDERGKTALDRAELDRRAELDAYERHQRDEIIRMLRHAQAEKSEQSCDSDDSSDEYVDACEQSCDSDDSSDEYFDACEQQEDGDEIQDEGSCTPPEHTVDSDICEEASDIDASAKDVEEETQARKCVLL